MTKDELADLRSLALSGFLEVPKHLALKAADEIERLNAALRYEQHRAGRIGTHSDGCWKWGPAHYECAIREIERLNDGHRQFVECGPEVCG